jgi:thiol-disulfide isomerase/thioredoxin
MKKLITTLALTLGIITTINAQYENTKIQIGQKAPDLAFDSPDGKKMVLSEINKGRYVLLDFWASWCGPCRRANPGVVRMYKEYSVKKFKGAKNGFTVVSVSMDKDKDKWVNAIKQDNLVWPYHMSDLVDWNTGNCAPANAYGVQFIPQGFLIDPNGKIIGKYQQTELAEEDIKKFVKE